ncbi:hypothetical protein ACFORG_23230 [Lutimaribacter marinistellae]|uniref:Cytochrome c domain-containing protein n=1 Tax=Lutimaribacter marinistellae TaxID=1820329 RepID=A0ABV7TMZ3_9RHOB
MRRFLLCLSLMLTASPSVGQDALGLAVPESVTTSGLLQHILPRFSLKTGIRVRPDPKGEMFLAESAPGTPVMKRASVTYFLRITENASQERFRDWLLSEVGQKTITGFRPETGPAFSTDIGRVEVVEAPKVEGDARRGAELSMSLCGRCHVVGPENRMNGLGSTPSFAVLRTLPDWLERFQVFYVLAPHPAFTQVKDITQPFDPERPPPIVPVTMSLEDLEAILAYVSVVAAADLGAPLQTQ